MRVSAAVRASLGRMCAGLTRVAAADDDWQLHEPLQLLCGRAPGRVLYLTKPAWLTMCGAWPVVTRRGSLVTRYGPVPRRYADVVRGEMRRVQAAELCVVGDLDPLDLTVLLCLACGGLGTEGVERVPRRIRVAWNGPRDEWLDACDRARRRSGWRGDATIAMTAFERKHWARLRALDVPWARMTGPRSLALLDSGRKLELEGASNPGIYGARFERTVRRLARL